MKSELLKAALAAHTAMLAMRDTGDWHSAAGDFEQIAKDLGDAVQLPEPTTDYTVAYELATKTRFSYNEICALLRLLNPPARTEQQPVIFVSPEQTERIIDPPDGSGVYIPMRKTPAGKFTLALYAHPPAQPQPRTLREGEVMGAYMDFDRTADPAWTSAEYLTRFGAFISERTVRANALLSSCTPTAPPAAAAPPAADPAPSPPGEPRA